MKAISMLVFGGLVAAQCYTDTFTGKGALVPEGNSVGLYDGVQYEGFDGVSAGPTGTTSGVIPHSGTEDCVAAVNGDLVELGAVTLNPFGNIAASSTKYFDLFDFWFGCAVAEGTANTPTTTGCTLSVTGFNAFNQVIPVATFSYAPTSLTAAPMVHAVLPASFLGAKNVTFGVANGAVLTAATLLYLDDVRHCNHN